MPRVLVEISLRWLLAEDQLAFLAGAGGAGLVAQVVRADEELAHHHEVAGQVW